MESAATTGQPPDEAEVEAVLARLSVQMKEIREQMRADDAEIARLKVESAELRAETRAILARLQWHNSYDTLPKLQRRHPPASPGSGE